VTNINYGPAAWVRGRILPEWLLVGGYRQTSALDTGRGQVVPTPQVLHGRQFSFFTVTTKPVLELRSAEDLDRLRKRLSELNRADPSNFPPVAPNDTPEVPTILPPDWSVEDFFGGTLNAIDKRAAMAAQESWTKTLAFYRSPRGANGVSVPWAGTHHASDWGIYLHSGGVEMLAREVYLPIGFDHATSLSLATKDLLSHELRHAALDVTALRLEAATGPSKELGHHACAPCLAEEALCNAAVVRSARMRADEAADANYQGPQHRLAADRLETFLTASPPGYRDWARVKSDEDGERLTSEILQHDGVSPIVGLDLYTSSEGRVFVPDVPLHLVLTPGSAAAAGAWEYGANPLTISS
jgi:hypothetical protein